MILISQILVFCLVFFEGGDEKQKLADLLPKVINKTEFGVSSIAFQKLHSLAKLIDTNNFEQVYQEELNDSFISGITYYLDNGGDQTLYKIIINFKDEASMELKANKLLGTSNYKGKDGDSKEWQFDIKADFPLHIWTFKNKIIYTMPLGGTEWNLNDAMGF